MPVSSIRATVPGELRRVWETVTSLENYAWRSDLDRIEVAGEGRFIEYTKDGFATKFTVTAVEPCARWEFDMVNENMKGHWRGTFASKGAQTEVEFTEDVTAKKLLLRPFVKAFLKKQQRQYILDLEKALR